MSRLKFSQDSKVTLGKIIGHFGVRGWLKVFSYTKPREQITKYQEIKIDNDHLNSNFELEDWKIHGNQILLKIKKFDNRDDAEVFKNSLIIIDRKNLPDLTEGQYYWNDLEGMEVHGIDGKKIGKVSHMIETGSNDVMVMEDNKELIPFIFGQVVKKVDLEKNLIEVDWNWD